MTNYKARTAYRDRETAESYDGLRFTSPQGKLIDTIERDAVSRLMDGITERGLVLDLASGSGRFAALALTKGTRVVAADISLALLNVSRDRIGSHHGLKGLVLCDAERLPFKDNAFDCVTAIRFMGMLPPPARQNILLEIRRVSWKWAILNFPNSLSAIVFLRGIWRLRRQSPEYYSTPPWALQKELGAAGFEIIEKRRPLLIPPRRFPKFLLGIIKATNWVGNWSPLGYFSEQYFVLVQKRHSSFPIAAATD